jgi:outer membrane protein insertion porin family
VKILTEPGSSSDRVILIVDLEEKSTGDFSVSGGYSTTDGALAEVSISERNFLGRGLYAKAAVTYGQYARGYSLSFVEPYLLDYRVALGLDLFQREQLANSYISYGTKTLGFSPRPRLRPARRSRPATAVFDLSAGNLAAEHAGELQQQSE